jgi:hypothetical protein
MSTKRRALFAALTVALSLSACLLCGEVAIRLLFKEQLEAPRDERSLSYRFDSLLGWFPVEGSDRTFSGYRTISASHNQYGFRDHEYMMKAKPRIAFLGDSFVWGFDVEPEERFTEKLQAKIPEWEVLNLGVSGYGTDQEFLLLQQWYPLLNPDIVFLVYTEGSDDYDNLRAINFGGYFKPFYHVQDDKITLKGVPVPKGAYYRYRESPVLYRSYFARSVARIVDHVRHWSTPTHTTNPTVYILDAMNEYLKAHDTQFAIGFHGYSAMPFGDTERKFCDQLGIPCVDLHTKLVYPAAGGHWTPQGHDVVAQRIDRFLHQ